MAKEGFTKGSVSYKVGNPGEIGQIVTNEEKYVVKYLGPETPPGPGVRVTPCIVEGENPENRDFADINIEEGYSSPLEWFNKQKIQITDYYLGGEGVFFAEDPKGNVYCTVFDNRPEQIGMNITYGSGWKQSWIAKKGGSGLHFLESCIPPWPSELPYEKIDEPANNERLSRKARDIYVNEVLPVLQ